MPSEQYLFTKKYISNAVQHTLNILLRLEAVHDGQFIRRALCYQWSNVIEPRRELIYVYYMQVCGNTFGSLQILPKCILTSVVLYHNVSRWINRLFLTSTLQKCSEKYLYKHIPKNSYSAHFII